MRTGVTTPTISICLPNLNTRPFLEERMESILAQTVNDWELIICDSYSDDGAWEFFQKFKGDSRIRMLQVPRDGVYAGWNECLRRAAGKYIYMATSDDTCLPDCLEKLLKPLERFPALKIALCDFEEIDEHSRPLNYPPKPWHNFLGKWMQIPSIRSGKTEFLMHLAFEGTTWVTMTSILFKRSLLKDIGLFRSDLTGKAPADQEWTLRASLASDVAYVPSRLATWRLHADQITKSWPPRLFHKTMLNCLQSVLHDHNSGIPRNWKDIPGWDRLLSAVWRQNQLNNTYALSRWQIRQSPETFFRDCFAALLEEPQWLFTQILRGFTSVQEIDSASYAQRLIETFHAPYPPTLVEGGW